MSHQIHQVGGILSIMNREGSIKADLVGVFAQETRADGVKCARPGQRASDNTSILPHDLCGNPLYPADHLGRRPAGKRQKQNPAWIGSLDNQMSHAMRQRVGLARPGARNDQEWFGGAVGLRPDAMFDGPSLFRIELGKIGADTVELFPDLTFQFMFLNRHLPPSSLGSSATLRRGQLTLGPLENKHRTYHQSRALQGA